MKAIPDEQVITVKEMEIIQKHLKWYEKLMERMQNRSAGYPSEFQEFDKIEQIIYELNSFLNN